MKLTKEDLMRLPKERLAEIILEMQKEYPAITTPDATPYPLFPTPPSYYCVYVGGPCNFNRDCFMCPHRRPKAYTHNGPTPETYLKGEIPIKNAQQ